ncbi:MAG TPA: biotin carboxylase N-terminal domain-containing protein [Verrucomicrobiae bacterium]|nr:biotin carboxylase N-terminal domain-containing protein [Verrucomicrobiae bacterium]
MQKILIANRGEIAIRIAKTCKRLGFLPCGIYSTADKNSLHIKYCKESMELGGTYPIDNYLNMYKIIDAAKKMDCNLIHPGYGFLAEKSEFAELCIKEGFVFVGPSPNVLTISGNKILSKKISSSFISVAEGKEVSNEDEALELANKIGYPVILKATKGGGGRGLRILRHQHELLDSFIASKKETMTSFGSDKIFIEKYIENPRHIEVQVIGDKSNVIHLGERECSIQRRYQKLIEETPSTALNDDLRGFITKKAVEIMKQIGYDNAGTVEFLFKDGTFYFMEINSRIQVEHPITEIVTGVDIVEQQLNISSGKGLTLEQDTIKTKGHAIECRINAENPFTFVPYPGLVKYFVPIEDDNIRIDSHLYSGYIIPPFYDSLIAKVISFGKNRSESIQRMNNALSSCRISGVPTIIPFHISALHDNRFLSGNYDTSFINDLKYYSDKNTEIAAAIFVHLPKKIDYIEKRDKNDPWIQSRYISYLTSERNFYCNNLLRWFK